MKEELIIIFTSYTICSFRSIIESFTMKSPWSLVLPLPNPAELVDSPPGLVSTSKLPPWPPDDPHMLLLLDK